MSPCVCEEGVTADGAPAAVVVVVVVVLLEVVVVVVVVTVVAVVVEVTLVLTNVVDRSIKVRSPEERVST